MFRNLSAVTLLALSALAAFPAAAGDRHNDHRFPGHRHAFHGGLFLGERVNWRDRGIRFDHAYGRRAGRDRMPFLKQFSSAATNRVGRSNFVIGSPEPLGYDGGDTYAGSSYVYQADGGTYVGGDGYGFYPTARPEQLAPKAKVIDIAVQDDPCAYEANVCVIRP
ncbi:MULTISPECIES: hypothetical protein [unclassified Rhizobium]|uniref:hypothetical protein n=1 Tax=unclassified Rhizobium TaxID=2613769 RepID=UPI001C83DBE3|nr:MULTISPECIES: hypothetical protein [unclassified Rhizobium]MBX5163677.1 hypothetical protein [Rhizobium sp. NZLR4b]MBX5183014.1 hypothetical protein [Rhizobium sp. NZLR5]MBX5189420.1 hypothetical protein [Rhizobium sp. NZLR3b]MBX5196232.1 hypothetical protein [Rhizobium sp. NZLR10]MBX5208766.1 hypothetical protein [Rhizobium sp. NZLR11]